MTTGKMSLDTFVKAMRSMPDHGHDVVPQPDPMPHRERVQRPSYRAAIYWLAHNDDTEWVNDEEHGAPSVTACLVADLFGVSTDKVTRDLKRELKKAGRR